MAILGYQVIPDRVQNQIRLVGVFFYMERFNIFNTKIITKNLKIKTSLTELTDLRIHGQQLKRYL